MIILLPFFIIFYVSSVFGFLSESELLDRKTRAAWQMPPQIQLLDISLRLIDLTDDYSCKELLSEGKRKIYLFYYPSEGMMLKGYISLVPEQKSQAPVLFFLRGGTGMFGLMSPANRVSCYGPYTVIGLSYRGSVSPGKDEYGGNDVADVSNLIKYFPKLAEQLDISLNSHRYLLGMSRGGMQMFLLLNRYKNIASQFKAVMSISGLLDLKSLLNYRFDLADMFRTEFNMTKDKEEQWILYRNPLANLNNIKRDLPIIIVQATKDNRVHLEDGKRMVKELINQGFQDVRYKEIQDATHSLRNIENDVEIIWNLFNEENHTAPR